MNNDGWMTAGAGANDTMQQRKDLQHGTQTADESSNVPQLKSRIEGGGPMKEHMDHKQKSAHHKHLEDEKARHEEAMGHHRKHMERHAARHYDSQYKDETHPY